MVTLHYFTWGSPGILSGPQFRPMVHFTVHVAQPILCMQHEFASDLESAVCPDCCVWWSVVKVGGVIAIFIAMRWRIDKVFLDGNGESFIHKLLQSINIQVSEQAPCLPWLPLRARASPTRVTICLYNPPSQWCHTTCSHKGNTQIVTLWLTWK